LKIEHLRYLIIRTIVAPRVGAWIEKNGNINDNQPVIVAPRVGAWIEKDIQSFYYNGYLCRSSRRSVD
jgi:hypothetical protein